MAGISRCGAFLLVPIIIGSSVTTTTSASQRCRNAYPGLALMARGVDITRLDLYPTDLSSSFSGFGRTLFEFTCSSTSTWSHHSSELSFDVPDQIAGLNSLPSGGLLVRSDVQQSLRQFKNWLAVHVGVETGAALFGAFSGTASYREVQEVMLRENQSLVETYAAIPTTQVDLKFADQLRLSADFLDYKRLPKSYESGAAEYAAFLDSFGTHYFETAQFGGFLLQKTLVDTEYLSESDSGQIIANLEARFREKINASDDDSTASPTPKHLQESLASKSTSQFYYYGGEANLLDQPGSFLQKWKPTIFANPALLSGRLKPIEELISDENIRRQVAKAIKVKRAKAYLAEVNNAIKLAGIRLSASDNKTLAVIERSLKDVNASEADLERYGSSGLDGLLEKVQSIRAITLLKYTQKLSYAIRDLRNCLLTATLYCDRGLHLAISRSGEIWQSLQSRLLIGLGGNLNSEQMFQLIEDVGAFYYGIEYGRLEVQKAGYQCLRNQLNRAAECQQSAERRHRFTINVI